MQLDGPHVGHVEKCFLVIAYDVVHVLFHGLSRNHRDFYEFWQVFVYHILLEEALTTNPVGKTLHYHGAFFQVRQHDVGDVVVIINKVAFRVTRPGPVHLIEMCGRKFFHTYSRTTSCGLLSSRRPMKAGWRIFPLFVHSVNSTSPTICGLTHVVCASNLTFES